MVFAIACLMYQIKKASADGRLFIWKTGFQMIHAKPITGFGYGLFDKNYNLEQAHYLQNNKISPDIQANTAYIKMAYNELLQHAIEGGLIGFCLILAFFLALLPSLLNRKSDGKEYHYQKAAGMGVIIFLVMSMTNFTFQAIPVMSVFFIYAAILCAETEIKPKVFVRSAALKNMMGAGSFVVGIWLLVLVVPLIKANYLNRQAAEFIKQDKAAQAIAILEPLSPKLDNYESYWRNYGNALLKIGHFADAEAKYNRAKGLTSDPELYIKTAFCEQQLGHYPEAAKEYHVATLIEPGRLLPKIALMNLYWKMNDTARCINEANSIANTPVKIPSQLAFRYKQSALMMLSHFQNYHPNQPMVPLIPITY